jgi:hypothetical protein
VAGGCWLGFRELVLIAREHPARIWRKGQKSDVPVVFYNHAKHNFDDARYNVDQRMGTALAVMES